MGLTEVRQELEEARDAARTAGQTAIAERLDHVLAALHGELLLTTGQAADLLGIGSINTVKALVHAGRIQARKVGTHYRIPLAEIDRLRDDPAIGGLAATEHLHRASEAFGVERGLTQEEMDMLSEARPGTLPWQRAQSSVRSNDQEPASSNPNRVP